MMSEIDYPSDFAISSNMYKVIKPCWKVHWLYKCFHNIVAKTLFLALFQLPNKNHLDFGNFHECTQNFLSPWLITMENEENASKNCLNMFLSQNIDSPYVSDHLQQF